MTRRAFPRPGQDADRLVPAQRDDGDPGPGREEDQESDTRRERRRRQTLEQIKASARALLAPHDSGELSLRAVARDVGIAPSGIYRYFESRERLMAALARDAYDSAQATLAKAMRDTASETPAAHLEQAVALARAYRRWCLDHRAEFSLLFATAHGEAAIETLAAEGTLHPFFGAPLEHYVRGIRAGAVDPSTATLPGDPGLSATAESMRAAITPDLSSREVVVLLWGWASLQGFIGLELLGPLASFYADMDAAYDQHVRAVFTAMGFRPTGDTRP